MPNYEKIKLVIPCSFYVITCQACGVNYALIGVIIGENEFTGEKEYSYMHQTGVHYCPYCGHNYKNKGLKAEADLKAAVEGE